MKLDQFIEKTIRETAPICNGNFEMKLTVHVMSNNQYPPGIILCAPSHAEGIIELDCTVKK